MRFWKISKQKDSTSKTIEDLVIETTLNQIKMYNNPNYKSSTKYDYMNMLHNYCVGHLTTEEISLTIKINTLADNISSAIIQGRNKSKKIMRLGDLSLIAGIFTFPINPYIAIGLAVTSAAIYYTSKVTHRRIVNKHSMTIPEEIMDDEKFYETIDSMKPTLQKILFESKMYN
ncbi:MAG: hypothetical protein ABIC91_00710 [Nanoarchaeota archaeon]|nr:hypothetical protein [Nanoarchaeota archaeon]MBU1029892.1 hypothetical protein [Nanoarchaeota archaeon]MBU1850579.1 hypothetical protein [Nanoarchaeota archaeon]